MIIQVKRKFFTNQSTIGILTIDSIFQCYTLEDRDRFLLQTTPLPEIERIKVMHQTCIPYGTYEVIMSHSIRFDRVLPEVLNVPGFSGIRLHAGNTAASTSGCLLLGMDYNPNAVTLSRVALSQLLGVLTTRPAHEGILLSII